MELLTEPGFLSINRVPSWKPSPIVIPAIPTIGEVNTVLCPVRVLRHYLVRTQDPAIRKSRSRLLIPFKLNNSSEIQSRQVSLWTSRLIRLAYEATDTDLPSSCRTHEVRALASSWALYNFVPFEDIMSAAYWRSSNSFYNCYLRNLSQHADALYAAPPVVAAAAIINL